MSNDRVRKIDDWRDLQIFCRWPFRKRIKASQLGKLLLVEPTFFNSAPSWQFYRLVQVPPTIFDISWKFVVSPKHPKDSREDHLNNTPANRAHAGHLVIFPHQGHPHFLEPGDHAEQ